MTAVAIHLQEPYLILPSLGSRPSVSAPRSPSAFSTMANPSLLAPATITPPSSAATSHTSLAATTSSQIQPSTTTLLKGTLVLTISKPIRVASLAITLNGSSHLALSAQSASGSGSVAALNKRIAHYSRQHLRTQKFLIEPSPDPEQYTTIVAPSASSAFIHNNNSSSTSSATSLSNNQIAYPFAIEVPNNIPVSVATPHGGTIYSLNAELTLAKQKLKSSGGVGASSGFMMALLSAATGGGLKSSIVSSVAAVQIYRAGLLRSPSSHCDTTVPSTFGSGSSEEEQGRSRGRLIDFSVQQQLQSGVSTRLHFSTADDAAAGGQERQRNRQTDGVTSLQMGSHVSTEQEQGQGQRQDEDVVDHGSSSGLIPDSISHNWPNHLEATISIPYVHLPPKSKPNLCVRIKLLRSDSLCVKSFHVALWERVIFRVAKTVNSERVMHEKQTRMTVVGIRERVINTQYMDKDWPTASTSASSLPDVIEKVFQFATPSSVRGPNELYSSRNCNASTYDRISKPERQSLQEDSNDPSMDPSDIEFGDIDIEIQHFLRCGLIISGAAPSKASSGTVERQLGDIPVVIRGVPGADECDVTGLPTYMGSFATSLLSLEETQTYEAATRASMSAGDIDDNLAPDYAEEVASTAGSSSVNGDFMNDDTSMAIMGLRGSRTPPTYEDSLGRPSIDVSISELQLSPPVAATRINGDRSNRSGRGNINLGLTR
ncbi:hypothetical protein EDD21DRAFT_363227 [Dissophora ornata]|nr:hypothetical protein BGZ58_000983 [Dissophora ornata]KAI8605587.1 hypothetical protein EDD21DRAFT_363227 [Dissophora ornata]